MPASASAALSGPAASVRPQQVQPHANGPSRSMAQGTQSAHHRSHKHSTSADVTDNRIQKPSQRKHDKDLPTVPGLEPPRISRPTQMSEAERYKAQSQQKYSDKEYPATPSSQGHGSLSSSHGHYHGHTYSSSHGHTTTTASQSSHTSGSSIGRHRSATVAGYHGGSGLDVSTSSSSSAQGHSSSSKLRRKPVRAFEEPPPTEQALWEPGNEPMVISPTDATMPTTASGRSRNRSTGVYRDPPTSATVPMNAQATWSRATGASAASSTKTIGQPQYVLQDTHHPLPTTTNLGRHHHSASAVPVGSHRTTVQTFFTPNGAAPTSSNQTQDKLVYRASSSTGHGSGSGNSSTPTPKANQFATTTPTQSQAHALAHANAQNAKAYKLSISANEQAANATAPAGISYFTVPMNSSSDEQQRSTRGRKESHRRTASASTSGHAMSPSTASASTEGSSHGDGDGDGEGDSDLWKSGTSLSQMSQTHASMSQKRGRQHSSSQQRLPAPTQPAQRRSRGSSDAPAPQAHYLVKLPSSRKDEKDGGGLRPGTAMSGGRGDEERGRGRTKEKDTSFFGRVRARSNSLTKGFSKAIQYPLYLAKGGGKRSSKQVTANANGSDGALAYSELGHGGRTSGEDAFEYAYTPSTATTSTTTTSTAASPISAKHPGTNGGGGNGNPSKSSVNILPAQHQYTPTKPHKREHKRSFSAQPALGHMQALSPPPPQQRSTGAAGAPSAFQRLKKPLTAREREQRDLNRASPMTRAKNDILQMWEGVDVDPRRSGVVHAQVQVSHTRFGEGIIAFPRVERDDAPPSIPFMVEQPAPRRR